MIKHKINITWTIKVQILKANTSTVRKITNLKSTITWWNSISNYFKMINIRENRRVERRSPSAKCVLESINYKTDHAFLPTLFFHMLSFTLKM